MPFDIFALAPCLFHTILSKLSDNLVVHQDSSKVDDILYSNHPSACQGISDIVRIN